jgi:hypothetical protein
VKPAHQGMGNSHGKWDKALVGPVSGQPHDEKPFSALTKVARKEWVRMFLARIDERNEARRRRVRAENEAELQHVQEKLNRRHGSAA